MKGNRIYLDYASITPTDPRVLKVMEPYFQKNFHNPSSLYEEGRMARAAIDQSRKKVAHVLQVKPSEIFFTSGGTESNNLALQGVFRSIQTSLRSKRASAWQGKMHMITSAVEHSSVLEIFKYFETKGVDVTYLSVDADGLIQPQQVVKALKKETVLISLMYGNNEIGTINDISKISKAVIQSRKTKKHDPVIFHTDASQGACYLNIRADYLGVNLITIDGSKIYGPHGNGILYIKRGTSLKPIFFGGGHEEGIRSGTENTAGIVGISEALTICERDKKDESKRLSKIRDYTVQTLKSKIPNLILNGSEKERLPNNINVCLPAQAGLPHTDAEFLVIKLDLLGIACSSVTTCKNLMEDSSSYVLESLDKIRKVDGHHPHCSKSSLRISLGRFTSKKELDKALKIIIKTILAQK